MFHVIEGVGELGLCLEVKLGSGDSDNKDGCAVSVNSVSELLLLMPESVLTVI